MGRARFPAVAEIRIKTSGTPRMALWLRIRVGAALPAQRQHVWAGKTFPLLIVGRAFVTCWKSGGAPTPTSLAYISSRGSPRVGTPGFNRSHVKSGKPKAVLRAAKEGLKRRPTNPLLDNTHKSSATAAGNARSAATIADKLPEPSNCPAGRRFAAALLGGIGVM
jgi:hypothetical protein